jgi:hypothetical protein
LTSAGVETLVNLAFVLPPKHRKATMNQESRRLLIQGKLDSGALPRDSIQRIWGAYANADTCDGCDEVIPANEYVIEGISVDGHGKMGLQFHVLCFALWEELRRSDGA